MAGNQGGARPGAGRPRNRKRHKDPIQTFTEAAAAYLPRAFLNLQALAEGSRRTRYQAAGTIFRRDVLRQEDGSVYLDGKGKPVPCQVPVYPDLPPDQLVLVEAIELPPEFRANEYLANRVMGTPIAAATPDPEAINLREALETMKARQAAYVDPDQAAAASDAPDPEVLTDAEPD